MLLRKPPSGSGTGAPSPVPTASTDTRTPRAARVSAVSRVRGPFIPSVTRMISPMVAWPFSSSSRAMTSPRSGRLPCHRDDAGVDGREQMDQGVGVAGERGHDERIPCEDHEPGAAVAAAPKEIGDLVARAHHARRDEIARIHGTRDVEDDHPRREGAETPAVPAARTRDRQGRVLRTITAAAITAHGHSRRDVPAPTTRWGSSSGSTIASQEPPLDQWCRSHHTSASPGGIAASHHGRMNANSVITALHHPASGRSVPETSLHAAPPV